MSLREEIRSIQKKLGITTIFVTHDQEEALSISDRIVVMYGGKAEQVGTPFEIYNRPATKFVANFVGTLNVLEGTVTDAAAGKVRVNTEEICAQGQAQRLAAPATRCRWRCGRKRSSLGRRAGHDASLTGEIAEVHFLGSVIRVRVGLGEQHRIARHVQQFEHAAANGRPAHRNQLRLRGRACSSLTRSNPGT